MSEWCLEYRRKPDGTTGLFGVRIGGFSPLDIIQTQPVCGACDAPRGCLGVIVRTNDELKQATVAMTCLEGDHTCIGYKFMRVQDPGLNQMIVLIKEEVKALLGQLSPVKNS